MLNKSVVLTYEGLEKFESELDYLKTVKRREIAEKIKLAMAFGDLSENSEYDEAKNEQAQMEMRIVHLENLLKNAKVIDEEDITTDVVSVGVRVKVKDLAAKKTMEFNIVGSSEADPMNMKISDESPVGAGLIGKKVGEKVEIEVPAGTMKFQVMAITK